MATRLHGVVRITFREPGKAALETVVRFLGIARTADSSFELRSGFGLRSGLCAMLLKFHDFRYLASSLAKQISFALGSKLHA
jgi:hypothetical protein